VSQKLERIVILGVDYTPLVPMRMQVRCPIRYLDLDLFTVGIGAGL
jgi:hypothetical protein